MTIIKQPNGENKPLYKKSPLDANYGEPDQVAYLKLVKVVQSLSLAKDLNTISKIVRNAARELAGSDGATFVLRDAISPLWKGKKFPMSACISGWAMLNKQSVAIEDIYQDERIPVDAYRPTFVKSLLMVPIRTDQPIGAIGNYWSQKYKPTQKQIILLQALADSTSIAMENVQLYSNLNDKLTDLTYQEEKYRQLSVKLQNSLDEKVLLLKETHYRVQNNLQFITKLLNLHADSTSLKSVKFDLQKSVARITSMSLIHEMLYQSENLSKINMEEYIKQLIKYIYEITETDAHYIKISSAVQDISLTIDKAIPVGIILNELITNCIKHAFPENHYGNIYLLMRKTNGRIHFSVSDDGHGMSSFTDAITYKPLGLELVKMLMKQINGEMEIECDKGTKITISFPEK